MFVLDAMNADVRTISSKATIKKALIEMKKHRIGSLIVVDNKEPVGIITSYDIFSRKPSKNIFSMRVSKFMSRDMKSVSSKDSLNYAAIMMMKNKISRLPVIDEGKLVGILTANDMDRYQDIMAQQAKTLFNARKNFVERIGY